MPFVYNIVIKKKKSYVRFVPKVSIEKSKSRSDTNSLLGTPCILTIFTVSRRWQQYLVYNTSISVCFNSLFTYKSYILSSAIKTVSLSNCVTCTAFIVSLSKERHKVHTFTHLPTHARRQIGPYKICMFFIFPLLISCKTSSHSLTWLRVWHAIQMYNVKL